MTTTSENQQQTTPTSPSGPKIDSMMLSSPQPDVLASWYAEAFDIPLATVPGGYQVLDLGGFYVMFDSRDDVTGTNACGARLIVNVDVADPQTVARRLDDLGSTWISALENRDGSWFGTVADPDGNWLQIISISEEMDEYMSGPSS